MDAYPASTLTAPAPRGFARRSLRLLTGLAGIAVLVGLIIYAGPARLAGHLYALGPLLPFLLVLTGVRYFLQAAAWRVAMTRTVRGGGRSDVVPAPLEVHA